MHFYDEWAQRILQGHLTDHLAFYGLPLYAYLLALIYKLVGYGPFVPGLLQACLEAGTATIIYKLGVRVFSRPPITPEGIASVDPPGLTPTTDRPFIAIAAALGWAFFVPAQAYAVVLMPTVWLVFAFWFMIWLIMRREVAPSHLACFGLGLFVGFVAMGVATVLFLLPLLLGAIFLKPTPARTDRLFAARAVAATLLFAGIGVGASPCWIHNYFVARDPVLLSAHSGVNYWIGNNSLANGYPRFPPGLRAGQQAMLADSIIAAEKAAGHSLKRSDVSSYWSAKTKNYIGNHFGDWLKLLGTKTKNFWSAFQYDDLSIITNLREEGVVLPGLYFGLIAALAIPGMVFAWRIIPESRWIIAAVLLSMFSLLPVFITERYRLVAGPGLLLLAAFGLSTFWEAWIAKRFRIAAVYLALLVASTILVAWPQRDPSLWALDAYNSGWQALESNNLATAERKLNLAYAYVPTNAETNFALGNLRWARGEKLAAESYYRATLEFDPNHQRAYNNLGVLALEEKRWNEAADFFSKAVQQDPLNAKTHYLLAEANFNAGDLEGAEAEIAEALKLNPAPPEFCQLQEQIENARRGTTKG
jgi:Tfp pilus assembly protein PilF